MKLASQPPVVKYKIPVYKVLLERSGEVLSERSDKVAPQVYGKSTPQLIRALGVICSIACGVSEAMAKHDREVDELYKRKF